MSERQLHSWGKLQTTGDLLHFLGRGGLDLRLGVAVGGEDQVLQHFGVSRVDDLRIELDCAQLAFAVQGGSISIGSSSKYSASGGANSGMAGTATGKP